MAEIRAEVRGVVRGFHFPGVDVEEELIQETLARLVVSLKEGRFRGQASLKAYAQNVAKYTCLEHRRRREAPASLDPEELPSEAPWSGPEQSFLDEEQHRRNLEAFAALPPECRELLLLINLEGLSYREVGNRLGITEGAIKSRVRRMRELIRRLLAPGRDRAVANRPHAKRVQE